MYLPIIVFIVVILIILLWLKVENKRLKISILIGFGISLFSFIIFVTILFSPKRAVLWPLLLIFYITIILFLILWNKNESKKKYLLLSVPIICLAIGITIIGYDTYIRNIPTVKEYSSLYRYSPFEENNLLAKLDGDSNLKFINNFPVLDGSTALYPVYASFAQALYSESEYKASENLVFCNGTAKAYDNILKSKADIIFCAAPSDLQIQKFRDNGLNLKFIPIGMEAFVFFVNKNNIIDSLTIENIQGIYSGRILNWKEVNGKKESIKAFQRPKGSGSQTALENIMDNISIINPLKEDVSDVMSGIINQVADYRNFSNAIGFSFLFYSTQMVQNSQIKLLAVNGIYPSQETIQDGSYPFSDNFYAVFIDTEEKNENIELFIEWILSTQGQTLISKAGYIPKIK